MASEREIPAEEVEQLIAQFQAVVAENQQLKELVARLQQQQGSYQRQFNSEIMDLQGMKTTEELAPQIESKSHWHIFGRGVKRANIQRGDIAYFLNLIQLDELYGEMGKAPGELSFSDLRDELRRSINFELSLTRAVAGRERQLEVNELASVPVQLEGSQQPEKKPGWKAKIAGLFGRGGGQ